MSIDHLKKQAKNLKKTLPTFLQQHPGGDAPLSQFQELIAKANGYPSWHTAVHSYSNRGTIIAPVFDVKTYIGVTTQYIPVTEYTTQGKEKKAREFDCAIFYPQDDVAHQRVVVRLDEFLESEGYIGIFGDSGPPDAHNCEMVKLCQELTRIHPGFIDGYAHLCCALWWLGEYSKSIVVGQPVFDQLCELLPTGFKGRIPYSILKNRPFHRLAHCLVTAHYRLESTDGDEQAQKIAKKMLNWWPNDNIGFRFLLERPSKN
jgi:hypothetical protein